MIKDTWFKIYICFVVFWIVAIGFILFFPNKEKGSDTVLPASVEQPTNIGQEKGSVINNNITVTRSEPVAPQTYATKVALASTFTSIPKPTQTMELVNYTVRRGDTLAGLAKIFGTSVGTLMTLNNLTAMTPLIPNKMILVVPKITN